jgi:hypothetical protein
VVAVVVVVLLLQVEHACNLVISFHLCCIFSSSLASSLLAVCWGW